MTTDSNAGAPEAPAENSASPEDAADASSDKWNPDIAKARIKKANDEAASLRRRLKDLEPVVKKAEDEENARKSESQKLIEALEAEKSTRTNAETELLRYRTAAEKGVPLNLVRFLSGTTAEEVAESADLLLKELGTKPATPARPQEKQRLSSGKPSDAEGSDDPLELIKQARAQRI